MLSVVTFMKDILLQMPVRREIDRREWNVTKQTCTSPLIQADDTQLTNDVDGTFRHSPFGFSSLTLDLQTNFPMISRPLWADDGQVSKHSYTISRGLVNI